MRNFISINCNIKKNTIVADGVRIYGKVIVNSNVIIEPNVIIGHPSPIEQKNINSYIFSANKLSYDDIVDMCVSTETIIDEDVVIRSGSVIYSGTHIHKNVDIAHNCLIRENSVIGTDTHIITGSQIMASVNIGHGCRIAGTLCNRTNVGNCTSMLGHVMHKYKMYVPGVLEFSPQIGNGVIVGREVAIIGNVNIGDFSIIGAGSVVTKSIPDGTIWAGNPITQIGYREQKDISELLKRIKLYEKK